MPDDRVDELLRRCTFRVQTQTDQGTCFAVSQDLLLTCRHVVAEVPVGGRVDVYDPLNQQRAATVAAKYPADSDREPVGAERWPDLALLRLADGETAETSVLLDAESAEPGSSLRVGGFPADAAVGFQVRYYTKGSSMNQDEGGNRYTMLSHESIDPGLSGAGVLTQQGFVCGYVRITRSRNSQLGGFFVPIASVLGICPELDAVYETPAPTAVEWLETMTAITLKNHGRDENGGRFDAPVPAPAMLDLEVRRKDTASDGAIRTWTVRAPDTVTATELVRAQDLGDGVLEAVDHWSRRHQLVSKEQVGLLGRVLQRGLLPGQIHSLLGQLDTHAGALVRLRVADADPLTDIPWEYAEDLATDTRWAFSRYVSTTRGALTPAKGLRALIVVIGEDGEEADSLRKLLDDTLTGACHRITFAVVSNPDYSSFERELERGWDVVHYVGTSGSDGSLGFSTPWQASPSDRRLELEQVEWPTVVESLSEARPKVVVLQTRSSRFDQSPPLSTFLDVLVEPSDVRALVLAEHCNSSDHVLKFSSTFYGSIDSGTAVEVAVQATRCELKKRAPSGPHRAGKDYAAFGMVCVVTTSEGNVRLLHKETGGHEAGGPRRPKSSAPASGSASVARERPPDPVGDGRSREDFER